MRTACLSMTLFVAALLPGCLQTSHTEQRVVELPPGNPDANLDAAAQIGRALVSGGLAADIQKQFPSLSTEQLKGLYLTWNAGDFQGKKSVFFLTGIQYSGTMPTLRR